MSNWLVLTASLPTSPSGLRVRIWRALKAIGCATLREGVYILPSKSASVEEFWAIHAAIREGGAGAHLIEACARDEEQEQAFRRLFDRRAQYAEFVQSLNEARKTARRASEPELRKRLHALARQLQSIRDTDHVPGKAGDEAAAALEGVRVELERRFSPGEPGATGGPIERLEKDAFQGRTWATRSRPWIDRLATAWLIRRFVDAEPRFLWLADPKKCPKRALGFDFDGARFSHVDGKVTFEVVANAFGLDTDDALRRVGELVHYVDVGGIPVDQAAGIATLMRGLQAQHADDDALLSAASALFDTLYAALRLGE